MVDHVRGKHERSEERKRLKEIRSRLIHTVCYAAKWRNSLFPAASIVRFKYPARGQRPAVDLIWYEGGMKPPIPEELDEDRKEFQAEAMMFVGDKGKMNEEPRLMSEELRKEFMWIDGGKGFYDNMWCINPEETIQFMRTVAKPWVAFKILAAGAIQPRQGFSYALRNGADFIAVGMFDFQIVDDVNITMATLKNLPARKREWFG